MDKILGFSGSILKVPYSNCVNIMLFNYYLPINTAVMHKCI